MASLLRGGLTWEECKTLVDPPPILWDGPRLEGSN